MHLVRTMQPGGGKVPLLVLALFVAVTLAVEDCNYKPQCPTTGTTKYPIPCRNKCNKYFECKNGKLTTKSCFALNQFDPIKLECQYAWVAVDCDWFLDDDPATLKCPFKPECPATAGSKIAIPCEGQCNEYVECKGGHWRVKKCGLGHQNFDPATLTCKTRSEVNCNWWKPTEAPTQPPVTQPPATQPPATLPPATQPPATQPPSTQPPETKPPATLPPATQPPATQPPSTQPPETKPPATQPPPTQPPATQPPPTQPPATQPPATQPPPTQPPATQPPPTQPPATQPPPTQPPSTQPPATQPPPTQPPATQPPPTAATQQPLTTPPPATTEQPTTTTEPTPTQPAYVDGNCKYNVPCPSKGTKLLANPCPGNCQKYFKCKDGLWTAGTCLPWENFDPEAGICTLFYAVNCTSADPALQPPTPRPTPTPTKPCTWKPTCPATGTSLVGNPCPGKCQAYYECKDGKAESKLCLPWENFDPVIKECTLFWTVDCTWGESVDTNPATTSAPTIPTKPTNVPPHVPSCNADLRCPATGSSKLPIPCKDHCRDYIQCTDGKGKLKSCTWPASFDPTTKKCAWWGVDCDWYLKPQSL